jgi:hypothetical protein
LWFAGTGPGSEIGHKFTKALLQVCFAGYGKRHHLDP